MNAERILKEKYNLELPVASKPVGSFVPVARTGNVLYVSGQTPKIDGKIIYIGKLGSDFTVEEGQEAARYAMLNSLALLKSYLGDLDKIKRFVHVLGFVRSADGFGKQPSVMDGASNLLINLFGEECGAHSRMAIGANELPGGAAVEVSLIVEDAGLRV